MAYDYKKTLLKVGKSFVLIALIGMLSVYQEQLMYLGLIPLIEGIINFLKHTDFWKPEVLK